MKTFEKALASRPEKAEGGRIRQGSTLLTSDPVDLFLLKVQDFF